MTAAILVGPVSDSSSDLSGKLVDRAVKSSSDERVERLLWLYTMNEYLASRGTNADVEFAMKKFSMAEWDSSPSRHDFAKMFHIAIASLRKSIETKLIHPLEKTLDKEEEQSMRLKKEVALVKRKYTKRDDSEV